MNFIGSKAKDLTIEEKTAIRHSIVHFGKEEHPFPGVEELPYFSVRYALECLAQCYFHGGFDNDGKQIILSSFQKIDG